MRIKIYLEMQIADYVEQLKEGNQMLISLTGASNGGRIAPIDIDVVVGCYRKTVEAITLIKAYNSKYGNRESLECEVRVIGLLSEIENDTSKLIRKLLPRAAEERQ